MNRELGAIGAVQNADGSAALTTGPRRPAQASRSGVETPVCPQNHLGFADSRKSTGLLKSRCSRIPVKPGPETQKARRLRSGRAGRAVAASATQGGHKARADPSAGSGRVPAAREVDRCVRSRAGSLRLGRPSNRNVVAQIHMSPGPQSAPTHANRGGDSISIVENTDMGNCKTGREMRRWGVREAPQVCVPLRRRLFLLGAVGCCADLVCSAIVPNYQ